MIQPFFRTLSIRVMLIKHLFPDMNDLFHHVAGVVARAQMPVDGGDRVCLKQGGDCHGVVPSWDVGLSYVCGRE